MIKVLFKRNEKMRYCISFVVLILPFILLGQGSKNLDLVSKVEIDTTGNDVWGFKHSNGIEYAIMGDNNSTRIISLEDPSNPVEVADIPGARSIWRDFKSFNDVVYVVADRGQDGVLIIDLSMIAQDSVSFDYLNLEVTVDSITDQVRTCHNLYIAEDGYLYLSGCNVSNKGVIIFDLNENPLLPSYAGIADLEYAHDVFVEGDLMYSSEIFLGQLGIYDISDKSNPTLKGTTNTPNNFTHNAWSSTDNNYVFTTDERGESFVAAYDVSDLEDIKYLDKIKPIDNVGAIPHNTHFHENYLYTSWYTEGVRITDVTRPDNMIEVGYYDTWEGQSGGFNGCWGAYPFLPSGLLLANDRQNGLFILQPTLVRASYLEGSIVDSETGEPVNGVKVYINSEDTNDEQSDANGVFKTGQCTPGEFVVTISHPEYHSVDTTLTLSSGEVIELDISIDKRAIYNFSANTGLINSTSLPNTNILLESGDQTYLLNSGQEAQATQDIFEGEYRMYSGRWGYLQKDHGTVTVDDDTALDLVLEEGYEDDFLFDFGWQTFSDASSGEWVRGVPIATTFQDKKSNVDFDLPDDLGNQCYITGNAGGQGGTDDIDNGTTTLTSDWFSAEGLVEPAVWYYTWFFNAGGDTVEPNDSLNVFIITPIDTHLIETIKRVEIDGEWIKSKKLLSEDIDLDSLKIMFVAQDDVIDGHLVEAGVDNFRVIDNLLIATNDVEKVSVFSAFPNPLNNQLTIRSAKYLGAARIRIFDTRGQLVYKDVLGTRSKNINLPNLGAGTYFLNVEGKTFQQTIKLVKI